jgi:hypothetical protein
MKMEKLSGGASIEGRYDLSIVLGGPLHALYRRMRVSGDALELVHLRMLALSLLAWLPLLVLSMADGYAWSGVKVPFLLDIETHLRLLVALPLLVVAELIVHQRMPVVVRHFVEREIISDAVRPKFEATIESALRLRNSMVVELLLLFVYGIGVGVIWRQDIALPIPTWFRQPVGTAMQFTLAGWWYALVSIPVFQFLLFRWYFRLFVWGYFLWHVSHLGLTLEPLHPDQVGGLGFLSGMPRAFWPLLLAHGVLVAGKFADGIFFTGATLLQYKIEMLAVLALVTLLVVGPLLVFLPTLARTKRTGLRQYGTLAQRYVHDFDQKWLRGKRPDEEALIGSADIQSLADLSNSYQVVKGMQLVPVTRSTLLFIAIVTALPVASLLLTMISFDELLNRLVKMVLVGSRRGLERLAVAGAAARMKTSFATSQVAIPEPRGAAVIEEAGEFTCKAVLAS